MDAFFLCLRCKATLLLPLDAFRPTYRITLVLRRPSIPGRSTGGLVGRVKQTRHAAADSRQGGEQFCEYSVLGYLHAFYSATIRPPGAERAWLIRTVVVAQAHNVTRREHPGSEGTASTTAPRT